MRRLRNYLDGLPDEARCRRVDGTSWGVTEELLAQLIEEVSIGAAGMRRDKPRQIPRPAEAVVKTPTAKHGGLFAAAMSRMGKPGG